MLESCKDIECKIVQIAFNGNVKTSGLLKLYRNGIELPTARRIWIDFVVLNDEKTPYRVDSLYERNGIAYDVVITDDKDRKYYDGYKKRMRQTYYAEKHGLPLPADTIELERLAELDRKANEEYLRKKAAEERKHPKTEPIIRPWQRKRAWEIIRHHPGWYDNNKEYTDRELLDVLYEFRHLCN